jgi:hypothetical protein
MRRQAHFSLLRDTRDLLALANIKRTLQGVKPALEQKYIASVASRLKATGDHVCPRDIASPRGGNQ